MKGYNMFIAEPIIIMFKDQNWTHPNIQTIVDELKDDDQINESCQMWTGPWVRIYLEQEGKTVYTVCAFHDKEAYEEHVKQCYKKFNEGTYTEERSKEILDEILGFLYIQLVEDVWLPGAEQFCFSEFAEKLYEYFDFAKPFSFSLISPDVGVHDEGKYWAWST
jgi:hypothetical protein